MAGFAAGGAWVRRNMWLLKALGIGALLLLAALGFAIWASPDAPSRADVSPRESLAAYSWEELASISAEIAQCQTEADAFRCAAGYALCDASGSLNLDDAKDMLLSDGSVVRVGLAGVWHDTRSDGGKAGLTFALLDAAGAHAMDHSNEDAQGDSADSTGGWEASDMRAWLEGEFAYALPADLRAHLVRVQKRTANSVDMGAELDESGRLAGSGADWVGETSDRLWLFSVAELCGTVPADEELGVDGTMTGVYAAEGTQYRRFQQQGVQAFAPNALLQRTAAGEDSPCTWWLRTKTLEFGYGYWLVGTDGTPLNGLGEDARVVTDPEYAPDELWGPDHARGVVVGFCLG